MSQPARRELPDSGHAELSERGGAVRHSGLSQLPSAERGRALHSGIPHMPNTADGWLSAANVGSTVPDARYPAMSEPLWNRGTAPLPNTGHASLSEPLRNSGVAALSSNALYAMHAGNSVLSNYAVRRLHPRNAELSESARVGLYAGHAAVPK